MATQHDAIDQLWRRLHDLLYGPGRQLRGPLPTYMMNLTSASVLPDRFDQEMLNAVAALKNVSDAELPEAISEIRGKLHVAATTTLIGLKDEEQLQAMLDAIELGKA